MTLGSVGGDRRNILVYKTILNFKKNRFLRELLRSNLAWPSPPEEMALLQQYSRDCPLTGKY